MSLAEKVEERVRAVVDPETGMPLGDMGLIRSVEEVEKGIVKIEFTLTSPMCPLAFPIASRIKKMAEEVEGVKRALVYLRGHIMEETVNRVLNK